MLLKNRKQERAYFKAAEDFYIAIGREEIADAYKKAFPLYWKIIKTYRDTIIEASNDKDVLNVLLCELPELSYHKNPLTINKMIDEGR